MEEEASRFVNLVTNALYSRETWQVSRKFIKAYLSHITDDRVVVEEAWREVDDAAASFAQQGEAVLSAESRERLRFAFRRLVESPLRTRRDLSVVLQSLDLTLRAVLGPERAGKAVIPAPPTPGGESRESNQQSVVANLGRIDVVHEAFSWPSRKGDVPEDASDRAAFLAHADTAADTVNHALARLFLRLGPPPTPSGSDYAPVGGGGGGVQV